MTSEPIHFLSRRNCPLCDRGHAALLAAANRAGVAVSEFDVDEDDRLRQLYGERVPVILYRGRLLAEGRIDPVALSLALEATLSLRDGPDDSVTAS